MKNSILDYNLFEDKLVNISLNGKKVINTINPHSYVVAKKDKNFNQALLASDVLLPDGVGIVYAIRLLKRKTIKKIAGYDMFLFLMEKLNKENGSCFFLGSSSSTLALIEKKIKEEYPNVKVNSYSPPFKAKFAKEDDMEMISRVNKTKSDVLFLGLTAPKQEKWSFKYKNSIDTSIICSIGAVFDFYAETVKRPGKMWVYFGLEWFLRLTNNPKRLWKRTFISTPIFLKDILLLKLKKT